jgi:hypothetical protein
MVTKVEAIKRVLEEFNGVATWEQIYNNIEKYYPSAKASKAWKEGLRGVLYREIKKGKNFKRIGLGIYALKDYEEEPKPTIKQTQRIHSYIEGICLEIGKFKGFDVYTPDKTALFKDRIFLGDIATLKDMPPFTYQKIIEEVRRIDVIWFNKKEEGFQFPQRAFEIVNSPKTLTYALNRCLLLFNFQTKFMIIGPEEFKHKFLDAINKPPYLQFKSRFDYKDYDLVIQMYESSIRHNEIEEKFFKSSIGGKL